VAVRSVQAVTGAFGYSGKYIARKLVSSGQPVITLTNSVNRENEFGGRVPAFPFNFDQPEKLVQSLAEVDTLYNTYWVRFDHRQFTQAEAVRNTLTLFDAAKRACVRRLPADGNDAAYRVAESECSAVGAALRQ